MRDLHIVGQHIYSTCLYESDIERYEALKISSHCHTLPSTHTHNLRQFCVDQLNEHRYINFMVGGFHRQTLDFYTI